MLYEITFQSTGGGIFPPLCDHDHAHDLAPTTVEGIAARVSAETVARSLYEVLVARKGRARELAWRRQRLAQALTAAQPAGHRA